MKTHIHTLPHTQTLQFSLCTQSDITCTTCSVCVISTHMHNIRQTPRANTSNLFPTHKPNICFCSDMDMNDGTWISAFYPSVSFIITHLPVVNYSLLRLWLSLTLHQNTELLIYFNWNTALAQWGCRHSRVNLVQLLDVMKDLLICVSGPFTC